MFPKIPLNAFFDVSDANFCLPRIRSRPRHFPHLKTQITSSWENRLSWATSSRGAIPIERRAHFRNPPARQTAEYSRLNGKPGFKAGNRLAFQPRKQKSAFSTEQKQTDLRGQKGQIYPSKNTRKWAIECKTCACCDTILWTLFDKGFRI